MAILSLSMGLSSRCSISILPRLLWLSTSVIIWISTVSTLRSTSRTMRTNKLG